MMVRLFVAIDFPPSIDDQLVGLCGGVPGASWVDYGQFHMTLNFIGEVDGIMQDDIIVGLREIQYPSFQIRLKGIGFFPPRKDPKVLWVGVEAGEELTQLHKKIGNQLSRFNLSVENRKFTPHVTLARLKDTPSERVGHFLMGNNLFKTEPFTVQKFSLYSSVLRSSGPLHRKEESYSLS